MEFGKLITLTTSFGNKEYYSGVVKYTLHKHFPKAEIIELTNFLELYNKVQAAHNIIHALMHFPPNTFHIIDTEHYLEPAPNYLFGKVQNQYILCPDNGIYPMVDPSLKELTRVQANYNTFSDFIDKISPKLNELMTEFKFLENPTEFIVPQSYSEENKIYGNVIYVDYHGTIITNITLNNFIRASLEITNSHIVTARIGQNSIGFNKRSGSLSQLKNKIQLGFTELGFLYISMGPEKANHLLGLEYGDQITVIEKI